jgi:putative flippase GtrA
VGVNDLAKVKLPSTSYLPRQLSSFVGVGVLAALPHYGLLIGLVELCKADKVFAALCGYFAGGIVSYRLNRRHTFQSGRPHSQALWRFALVALSGFGLTYCLMHVMIDLNDLPYLPAQIVTTLVVMIWTFAANRSFTFRQS